MLFWLGAFFFISFSTLGQQETKPVQCTTTGAAVYGIRTIGGSFIMDPEFGCLNPSDPNATVTVTVKNPLSPTGNTTNNLGYIFDLKDNRSLAATFPPLQTSWTVSTPGKYWILQSGNENSETYITCKYFEVIKPEDPDISVSSCAPNSITVEFLATPKNRKHGSYEIDWGDGNKEPITDLTNFPIVVPHLYNSTPTTKPSIITKYISGTNTSACSKSYTFELNIPPKLTELEGLSSGTIVKITMKEGNENKDYNLEQKTNNGTWIDTGKKMKRNSGQPSATLDVNGLNGSNEYCFRLKANDGCTNPTLSNEVCSIVPKANITSTKSATINWNTPDPSVSSYTVDFSESPTGANANTDVPSPPTATTYTLNNLDCRKKYNFQITAFIGPASNQVIIKSPSILIDPAITIQLPAKTTGTVSVSNSNTINFKLFSTKESKYIFYRSVGGSSNFVEVMRTPDDFYDDIGVDPAKQQYCYKVAYQDECGNTSDLSPAFCSIFANSNQDNILSWTDFSVPSSTLPVQYYIESFEPGGNILNVNISTNNYIELKQQIEDIINLPNANGAATFRVKAVQGSYSAYSNDYTFILPVQLYIPSAFTPNTDGSNDAFVAKGRFIVKYNLEIYDRWGNVIFESNDLNISWDGTTTDGITQAPPGNYGFKIWGLDVGGNKFQKTGSIVLLK